MMVASKMSCRHNCWQSIPGKLPTIWRATDTASVVFCRPRRAPAWAFFWVSFELAGDACALGCLSSPRGRSAGFGLPEVVSPLPLVGEGRGRGPAVQLAIMPASSAALPSPPAPLPRCGRGEQTSRICPAGGCLPSPTCGRVQQTSAYFAMPGAGAGVAGVAGAAGFVASSAGALGASLPGVDVSSSSSYEGSASPPPVNRYWRRCE